jgi:hypothetical protein
MSMEIHVLFRGKLPSKAALQAALRELGFPFSIKPATGSLERQNGFMPMLLDKEETGAEFDVFEGRAAVEEIGGKDVDPRFDRVANFRWGGSMHECASAVCSAAALAKLVSGVVFDDEEGKLFSIDQAIAVARQVIAEVPKPSSPTLRPRRPSLKRLLKPLLDTRSDLVLLGRLLVIRPVRHLLRGAALHWMPKYSAFHVYRVVRPLFQATGIQEHGPAFTVWTGYLDVQGMLLDGLAGDVFPQLSRIASIDDLLDEMRARRYRPEFLRTPILLSGGNEQAEEYVAAWEKENQLPGQRANETPVKYEQEREQVFAECHAEEADRVRRFKLDSVWEPSPFPGERPRSGGAAHSSDPTFPLTPCPDYSTSWRHDPPQQQGETCFVMSWLRRCGKIFLLMSLSPTSAVATRGARSCQRGIRPIHLNEPQSLRRHSCQDRHRRGSRYSGD